MMKHINNLFVIDDDKIYHFLFKNLLKQNGINANVSFFHNGLEAIDHLKNHGDDPVLYPDLILLDINMPIMNGWQFLDEYTKLKDVNQLSPVYMISSSNNEVDINKAKEYNYAVKDYFLKPVCKDDLDKIFV